MKRIIFFAFLVSLSAGCDEHRDLYDTSNTVLYIEGSWRQSLNQPSMLDATVLLYKDGEIKKEFLSRPNGLTTRVTRGRYDIVTFNGVMRSEEVTNLNHVYFRGTDRLETFEAYAAEGRPISRLTRADGEYIASNEMDVLTFIHKQVFVEGERRYYLKYRDGANGYPEKVDYAEGTVEVVPRAMSYRFQVKLTNLVNPRGARSVAGAVRGFAGSVFMPREGEKPTRGFQATHHVALSPPVGSRTRTGENGQEVGMLQSPVFVTFGPPLSGNPGQLPASGVYFFDPVIVLIDNSEFRLEQPIDITPQVNEAILRLHSHHSGDSTTDIALEENLFTIQIDEPVVLPVLDPGKVVEVEPWEDGEEVIVWIGRD